LLKLYGPMVERWCRQAGVTPEDVADICQEVFHGVARGIVEFRRDRPGDSFRSWIRTITRRRLIDHRRKAMRQPETVGGSDAHDQLIDHAADDPPESDAVASEAREVFERALPLIQSEFEAKTWQAFWRTAVDDRSAVEVAAELGMTPGAVFVAKSRVLRRLREEFGDLM
jgi:RNA polymerase sigma-70 factor (ECF subfamily)